MYCALDERLGRDVALKVLREDLAADAAERARFVREGQIAAQIVHPNVVRTYDAGDAPEGPYLVQEFLNGQTLDQTGALPPTRAAAIIGGIAAALGAIHSRGYVHCDIKPQNILLRASDGIPVLLDFGIARAQGAATTTLIATPHYLAPERVHGAAPSAASDLYALGIVLYQAVTGRPPFDAPTIHAILQQHIETPVPELTLADPAAQHLDRVIAGLTAKRPQDRYATIEAVQRDLAAVEHNAVHAQPTLVVTPTVPAPLPPAGRSNPAGAAATAWSTGAKAANEAWSAAPPWRKRRWLAALIIPLILLLLGFGLARARQAADVEGTPDSRIVPAANTAIPVDNADDAEVDVPNLVGYQYSEAEQLLASHGLIAAEGDQRSAPVASGIVLQSDPPASTALAPGSAVTLHVSAGPAEQEPPPVAPAPAEQAPPPVAPAPPVEEDGGDDDDDDKKPEGNRGKGKDKGKSDD